jgi:hypothetical protein
MPRGKILFAQIMRYLPLRAFHQIVARHRGNHKVKEFTCLDQFLAMAFAQLTFRSGLRSIADTLRANAHCLYHMGFRCGTISRNTLANANEIRPWQMYSEFALVLIRRARELYMNEELAIELDATVFALDSTTIDLCLALFPWAPFRTAKAAIKLHTLLNLRGNNAVRTQVWIAVAVYVLLAIIKKELGVDRELHDLLEILSASIFQEMPILQAFLQVEPKPDRPGSDNQLSLF